MGVFYFSFKGESMYKLYNGDCLEVMDKLIKEGIKVDSIITDLSSIFLNILKQSPLYNLYIFSPLKEK